MKTIRTFNTTFGGTSYKAVKDGTTVKLMTCSIDQARYRTQATISLDQYRKWEDENDMHNQYKNDDPSIMQRLIDEMNGNYY